MRPIPFQLVPCEFFEKLIILSKINENYFFQKCVLKLCRTATINNIFFPDKRDMVKIFKIEISPEPNLRGTLDQSVKRFIFLGLIVEAR